MNPAAAPASWIDYWDSQTIFLPIMRRTARFFAEKVGTVLPLGRDTVLLDYGCGPGYLVEQLAGRVGELHGVDTSPRMIAECRRRFAGLPNVHFHQLDPKNGTDLSVLVPNRFSVIICLSVVQYFERLQQVEELIRSVASVAAPGARLLVADIPTGDAPLGDALELAWAGVRGGFVLPAVKFLLQSVTTEYARMRAAKGLLLIPVPSLRQFAARLALRAEVLKEPLTYSRRRVHLLVSYA